MLFKKTPGDRESDQKAIHLGGGGGLKPPAAINISLTHFSGSEGINAYDRVSIAFLILFSF